MNVQPDRRDIRILIADDDEQIMRCYREAFGDSQDTDQVKALDAMDAELFATNPELEIAPKFDLVACSQGQDAIDAVKAAADDGQPFAVVVLDVRMPPGIDGVEAGSQIRAMDPEVDIVFVTGFSSISRDELERRVPPPAKLHYFNKPLSFMKLASDVVDLVNTRGTKSPA